MRCPIRAIPAKRIQIARRTITSRKPNSAIPNFAPIAKRPRPPTRRKPRSCARSVWPRRPRTRRRRWPTPPEKKQNRLSALRRLLNDHPVAIQAPAFEFVCGAPQVKPETPVIEFAEAADHEVAVLIEVPRPLLEGEEI